MSGSLFKGYLHALVICLAAIFSVVSLSAQTGESKSGRKPFQSCAVINAEIDENGGIASDGRRTFATITDGRILAIDAAAGETLWLAELGGSAISAPVIADGLVVIAMSGEASARIFALSANTGLTVWNTALPAGSRYFLGQTAIGIVAISDSGDAVFLRPSDGAIIRKDQFGFQLSSEPAVSPHAILISAQKGPILTFSATGETLFRRQPDAPVAAGLLFGKMRAVFSDASGRVFAVNTAGGRTIWRFKTGGRVTQIVSLGGQILVGSADNFLYLLDSENGNVRWKTRLPARVEKIAVIDDETVAATAVGEPQVFIIDPESGRLADSVNIPDSGRPLRIAPVSAAGRLIVAATTGVAVFSPECGAKIQTAGRRKPAA